MATKSQIPETQSDGVTTKAVAQPARPANRRPSQSKHATAQRTQAASSHAIAQVRSGPKARTKALDECVGVLNGLQPGDREWVMSNLPGAFNMQIGWEQQQADAGVAARGANGGHTAASYSAG